MPDSAAMTRLTSPPQHSLRTIGHRFRWAHKSRLSYRCRCPPYPYGYRVSWHFAIAVLADLNIGRPNCRRPQLGRPRITLGRRNYLRRSLYLESRLCRHYQSRKTLPSVVPWRGRRGWYGLIHHHQVRYIYIYRDTDVRSLRLHDGLAPIICIGSIRNNRLRGACQRDLYLRKLPLQSRCRTRTSRRGNLTRCG